MIKGKSILIVDDDKEIRMVLKDRLEAHGFTVFPACDGTEGLQSASENRPDLMLLDLQMPDMDGITVLSKLKTLDLRIPVIMLTAHGTIEKAVEAMKQGAYDFIQKPCKSEHLLLVIEKALKLLGLEAENRFLKNEMKDQYHMVVGESKKMKEVMETVRKIASSPITVLVYGESGTGKQLISRTLHDLSDRSDQPFVQVNCTTLSEQLLESDLFGHEKGAFTGAIRQKKGRFEIADGGTLFLDEIGDLSSNIQARLLHVLEYGEFQRVGGVKTLKVDVRIVGATHKDLEHEVNEGRFREDLFFRLNVMTLRIPSLRERIEDISVFAEYFLEKHCQSMQKKIRGITPEMMLRLCEYDWPGNIRELKNVMERAVVLAAGSELTEDLLPPFGKSKTAGKIPVGLTLDEALHKFKYQYISDTLNMTTRNQTKAAEILDIQRTYLNRLIKELRIQSSG